MIRLFLISFLFCGIHQGINAQNDSLALEAGALPTSVHTAYLDTEKIQVLSNSDQLSIASQLNQIPGVQMQSGALNTNRIVIRGIGSRSPFTTSKIRAYLDEIPLTNGAGETTLEDIDFSFYEKIRLRKGPSSSLFGVGLGGVLQLQTPHFSKNKTELSSTVGSFGLFRQTVGFIRGNAEKKRSISLRYNYVTRDGFRENNNYERHGFLLNGRFGNFSYLLNYTDLVAQIPSALNATDFEENPRQAAANWAAVKGYEDYQKLQGGLSHRYVFGTASDWSLLSSFFGAYRPSYESRPFNILEENSLYGGLRSRILHEKRLKNEAKLQFSAGIELFREKYDWMTFETNGGVQGAEITANREYRNYWNVFTETEYKKEKHSLLLGLNLNQTLYDIEDKNSDFQTNHTFGLIASPLLQYQYEVMPNWHLKAIIGHGFSPPNTEETQGTDGRFNATIKPEQGWNVEGGIRYGKSANAVRFEANMYTIFVRDLLVSRRNAIDLWEGINAGKTQHSGLETSVSIPFQLGVVTSTFTAAYAYNHYRFTEFIDRDNDYSGNPLTGVPNQQGSASLDLKFPSKIHFFLNALSVGKMPLRDDNTLDNEAYTVLNAQLSKAFSLKKAVLRLDFGLQNVFDTKYASMLSINASSFGGAQPRYYYAGAGRNGYVRIVVEF